MAIVWKARQAQIKTGVAVTPGATALTATTGLTEFGAVVKDLTITEPEGAVEQITTYGTDGNEFQNAEMDEKNYTNGMITGTLVHDGDETLEPFAYGESDAAATGFTRYQPGKADATTGATRAAAAFLVFVDDGTNSVAFLLNNAFVTKLGDRKWTGADGHLEQDFAAECLPRDFYIEYED